MAFIKGLGSVHALSHAAGRIKRLNLHHGTLNAVFLPAVLRFNAPDCGEKYDRPAQAMGLMSGTSISEAVTAMNAEIGIPPSLNALGLKESDIPELTDFAKRDLSALTNPRKATGSDYEAIVRESF